MKDFSESIFSVEHRLWRSLRALFLQPGELCNAFLAGRRRSYMSPIRLYLVSSLVFFGLIGLTGSGVKWSAGDSDENGADSTAAVGAAISELEHDTAEMVAGLLFLTVPINVFRAQRRVFGGGWAKTLLKLLIVWNSYGLLQVLGIFAVSALVIWRS